MNTHEISIIGESFSTNEVQIVCYIRKRSDFLVSEYKQNIMMGNRRYNRSLIQFLFETRTIERLNYSNFLNKWSNVFGIYCINLALYDKYTLKRSDIIYDFIDLIGLNLQEETSPIHENAGLSDHAALLLRELNHVPMPPPRHGFIVDSLRGVAGENKILTQDEKDQIDQYYIHDDLKLISDFKLREKDAAHLRRHWKEYGEENAKM